jgi:hypothetical protein
MAGPSSANEGQITIVFGGVNIPTGAVCTLGLKSQDPDLDSDFLNPISDAVKKLHGELSTSMVLVEKIELKRGPNETGPTWEIAVNHPGHATGPTVPPNTSLLIRKELEDVSAKFSGRMFWPGAAENQVDDRGIISEAYMGYISAALGTFRADLELAGLSPIVFHGPKLAQAWSTVWSFSCQSRVATQRRRLRR